MPLFEVFSAAALPSPLPYGGIEMPLSIVGLEASGAPGH
jgi:hypothetical protein